MTVFPFIFARKEYKPLGDKTVNHESIHLKQQIELLILPFYLWYGIEWIVRLIQYKNFKEAYRNISFEREAYDNEKKINNNKSKRKELWNGASINWLFSMLTRIPIKT